MKRKCKYCGLVHKHMPMDEIKALIEEALSKDQNIIFHSPEQLAMEYEECFERVRKVGENNG